MRSKFLAAIVAILILIGGVVAFIFLKDAFPAKHNCESICSECNKCLDLECAEEACKDKCLGHEPAGPTEGLNYTVKDGVAYVTGIGTSTAKRIEIADTYEGAPVAVIANSAFKNCDNIVSVVLPETITTIEEEAFSNCSNLESINLPASLQTIESFAFHWCQKLMDVDLPASLQTIGQLVFWDTGVYKNENNWVNGVFYVDNYLLHTQASLSGAVEIAEGTLGIADFAFNGTKITEVSIPSSVTFIGEEAFNQCLSLKTVTWDSAVVSEITYNYHCGYVMARANTVYVKEGLTIGKYLANKFNVNSEDVKEGYVRYDKKN